MKKLFLLDGHALVYRAHFAFINRPLINSKGLNTSAISGFVRTLWDLMKTHNPTHLAVCFDTNEPTFRHVRYPAYKANRDEQPEDIATAIPIIVDILKAFHIPIVTLNGYEADDLIGTLAKQAEKENFQVYMVTPDKDFGQLVSENIFLYKPSRMGNGVSILGIPEVLEKWNITCVSQVVDMLALQGDSVDNIPGVPGIGPKTAAKLLASYETVERLLEHAHELKGKQKEKVLENADQARLSKELALIDTQAPVTFHADTYLLDPPDKKILGEIFKELEFRTLANAILDTEKSSAPPSTQGTLFASPAPPPPVHSVAEDNFANTEQQYHLVTDAKGREQLAQRLSKVASFSFDTETTGVDANEAELVGISFCVTPAEAWYVPIPEDVDECAAILNTFKPVLEDATIDKIGQNIKYDILMLKWQNVEIAGKLQDTMLMHYLLEPELRHNLNYLSETYLKYQPISIEKLIGKKGKNQLSMRDIPIEKVADYACEDADVTQQLYEHFSPELSREPALQKLYDTIEAPLIRVIADMEYNGVTIDADLLQQYSKELAEMIHSLQTNIEARAGTHFNINSPKQVGDVLFGTMKLPYRWSKTKSGQFSTSEDKLSELATDHPIVADILRYRGLAKLKSTYVDALPKLINPRTERVHSSFNQALAATGRLSSQNPNLQNIPIRTEEGRRIRKAFVARNDDYLLLAADYSQIELRLIAEISGDEAMLDAFINGQDIHRATAAKVYGTPYDEVTAQQRRNAKTVNFAIIYGAGSFNLSQQLSISRAEASDLIEAYFQQYNGLKKYMDETVVFAREKGYVTTLMGRRRYIRDINSRNRNIRSGAERIAINTPIQGTAADMIKMAMVQIHRLLHEREARTKLILQVHDELVFDLHKEEQSEWIPLIVDTMKNALPGLKVPIVVEAGVGQHWLEAH